MIDVVEMGAGRVRTVGKGQLPPGVLEYAQEKVAHVAKFAMRTVRLATVKLTVTDNPSVPRRFSAEAIVDVDGHVVTAHAEGREGREAVDLLEQRLRRRLDAVEARIEARRRRPPRTASTANGNGSH